LQTKEFKSKIPKEKDPKSKLEREPNKEKDYPTQLEKKQSSRQAPSFSEENKMINFVNDE
jgi:hypothetical protein